MSETGKKFVTLIQLTRSLPDGLGMSLWLNRLLEELKTHNPDQAGHSLLGWLPPQN